MDLSKLKLDKFTTYNGIQMPSDFEVPLILSGTPDVWFVFPTSFEELNRFTNQLLNHPVPKENRVFFIYKKGEKSFHRDHIRALIEHSPFLKMKAPILSSVSKTHSCFACMIVK